jgi:ligand-binding SRPBCC domain-containing protein
MKTFQFNSKIWLPVPRDRVFEFFANPGNLERLTPPWLHFEIVTPPDTAIRQGTLLDYRLRLRGLPLRWQSEISRWDPPHLFVDRQTKGPYSLWVHEHSFADHDGGTLVSDRVNYAVPGGRLVQKFLVAPDIERIFQFRHRVLEEIFAAQTSRRAAASGV